MTTTLTDHLFILLGNGADPEVFDFPCGANARSVTLTNNTGEATILPCNSYEEAQAAIVRWTQSQDTQITLSGRVALESFDAWRSWSDTGAVKNIQTRALDTAVLGGGSWIMPAILQSLELGVEGKDTVTFSATIVQAGPRVWTAAA